MQLDFLHSNIFWPLKSMYRAGRVSGCLSPVLALPKTQVANRRLVFLSGRGESLLLHRLSESLQGRLRSVVRHLVTGTKNSQEAEVVYRFEGPNLLPVDGVGVEAFTAKT